AATRVYGTMHEDGSDSGYSNSDIYTFAAVTGSKVRYSFDNRGATLSGAPLVHGWIYEFEVYGVPSLTITIPEGQSEFPITADPQPAMPMITANVQINGSSQPVDTTQFMWQAQITFTNGSIATSGTYSTMATGGTITFDRKVWGSNFRGGDLTLMVR